MKATISRFEALGLLGDAQQIALYSRGKKWEQDKKIARAKRKFVTPELACDMIPEKGAFLVRLTKQPRLGYLIYCIYPSPIRTRRQMTRIFWLKADRKKAEGFLKQSAA